MPFLPICSVGIDRDPTLEVKTEKKITVAVFIIMASMAISAALGLLREIVLANFGGTKWQVDVYVNAFALPEIINHIIAGSFLSLTFIPIYTSYLVSGDREGCNSIFSNIFSVTTVFLLFIVALTMVLARPLISLVSPGVKEPEKIELTVTIVRILLPAQLFIFWGGLFKAVQYANKKFFIPSLNAVCYNGGIICGGLFLAPYIGVKGFSWGVLFGAFVGNVVLQLPGALKTGLVYRPCFDLKNRDLRRYVFLTVPLVFGIGMTFSNEFFFRFFGSFLGSGGSSSLNYSLRTTMFLVTMFGTTVGVASFPFLTDLVAQKKISQLNDVLNGIIIRFSAVVIPLSIIMAVLAEQIVSVLYERGNFTWESTARTWPILVFYLPGAFAICAQIIVLRCYYACQRTWFAAFFSTGSVVLTLPFYWILCRSFGANGIALVSSCSALLQFFILFTLWNKWTNNQGAGSVYTVFLKVTAAGLGGAASSYLIKHFIIRGCPDFYENLKIIILAGGTGIIVSIFICYLLKVDELVNIIFGIKGKIESS